MVTGASWADFVADALRQRLLCHPVARAPVCMASLKEGRAHVGTVRH